MMSETGPEQPAMGESCPTCGHAAPAPESDIAEWIKAGWALFVRDIPMSIGLSLLAVVPCIAFVIFGYFGLIGLAIVADPETDAPGALAAALGGLLALLVLGMSVVVPALQAGVYACFLQGTRTGKLSSGRIWAGFRNWWSCTWVSGAIGAAILLCLPLAFVLVGIPIMLGLTGLMWFALFRIVDKERGGMEALSFAWGVMWGRLWVMLAYVLVVMALMSAGIAGAYLGVAVTVPIGCAVLAAAYDSQSREREPVAGS